MRSLATTASLACLGILLVAMLVLLSGPGVGAQAGHAVFVPVVYNGYTPPFRDDFSDPNSGWPIVENDVALAGYVAGEYRIVFKQSDWLVRVGRNLLATSFRAEVDTHAASSPDGSSGLYFASGNSGYYLYDVAYGQFELLRRNYPSGTWTVLIAPTQHSAIRTGTQVNRLKVVRSGPVITLYANGQQVAQTSDSALGEGYVGLAAGGFAAGYEARFDNFLLVYDAANATAQGASSEGVTGSVGPERAAPTGEALPEERMHPE